VAVLKTYWEPVALKRARLIKKIGKRVNCKEAEAIVEVIVYNAPIGLPLPIYKCGPFQGCPVSLSFNTAPIDSLVAPACILPS
jgi:hypothetical protein